MGFWFGFPCVGPVTGACLSVAGCVACLVGPEELGFWEDSITPLCSEEAGGSRSICAAGGENLASLFGMPEACGFPFQKFHPWRKTGLTKWSSNFPFKTLKPRSAGDGLFFPFFCSSLIISSVITVFQPSDEVGNVKGLSKTGSVKVTMTFLCAS